MLKISERAAEAAAGFPAALAPNLCTTCHKRSRAAGGRLSVCLVCLRERAEADRIEREAIHTAHASRQAAKDATARKRCRTCKSEKPATEFARHKCAKDGLRRDCKGCVAQGKAREPRTMTPEQAQRDRERRAKPHRRNANLQAAMAWQLRNAPARAAHRAVRAALKSGKIKKASTCEIEGCSASADAGHHNHYGKAQQLKLVWLCHTHHQHVHRGVRFKTKAGCAYRSAYAPATY